MIAEYNYVTKFNIPLAQSLDDADVFRLDCFSIIENEIDACINFSKNNGK